VRNIPSGNPEEYLCGSSCDLQSETEHPTAIGSLAGTAQAGLNPMQRRRVLAGNDLLLADLTLALDLLDDAILVLHESGRIIHCNQAASVLALPVKTSAMISLHALPLGEPWVACRKILREYQTRAGELEREVRDPGTGKNWSLRLSALPYLGVLPRRLVLVIRDISEVVKTQERLQDREVMAATGALLGGAAHQAKNAIFGLSATLDAFEARIKKDVSDDDYIDNLRTGITRMQTLLRDLLDYGNPTTCELEPVSMAAMVRRAFGGYQSLTAKMGVTPALDVVGDGEVLVSPARLVRALENLVENAIQHSPPAGTVTVRLSRGDLGETDLLRCDVLDQGPGFPPEHMEKLFTPFFTLRPGGTGLGLTIAKKIIEDCGGMIRLSNRASGGAQVTLFLPMANGAASELRNCLSECDSGPGSTLAWRLR